MKLWTFEIQMFVSILLMYFLFCFVFFLLSVFNRLEHKLDDPGA